MWSKSGSRVTSRDDSASLLRFCGAVCFLVMSTLLVPASTQASDSLGEAERQRRTLFEKIAPSVVFIAADDGLGSGFAITDSGLVLTNAHVVEGSDEVRVVLYDGRSCDADVVELADDVDLALISLPHDDLRPLPAADTDEMRVGDWVGSIGHGSGGIWTFNTGMVSNIYPDGAEHPVFQTQIPLNPGASGGPIFDRRGQVVGIVVAGLTEANSINFGFKIDLAHEHLGLLGGKGSDAAGRPDDERGRQRASTLTVYAPAGAVVFVNGKMAGTGPRVEVDLVPGRHEVFAVVDGKRVSDVIEFPMQNEVTLE